jgi:hypothetical protein
MLIILVASIRIITVLFGGILLFLMLKLIYINKKELSTIHNYSKGNAIEKDRNDILNTLVTLQEGYDKRDISKIDYYVENTMNFQDVLILGTNPNEIFIGHEGVKKLFFGDWRYWGKVKFNLEESYIDQFKNMAYITVRGEVRIDIWKIRLPLRLTCVMSNESKKWLISKLQFQYDINTNYVIFAMLASIGLFVSLILSIFTIFM